MGVPNLHLTIRLQARDFYEVRVDEGETRINCHLIEIDLNLVAGGFLYLILPTEGRYLR